MKNTKSPKLYQANKLTESRYDFSVVEKRAIYAIINQVRKDYVDTNQGDKTLFDNLIIKMKTETLKGINGKGITTNLKDIYKGLRTLRSKVIEIEDDKMLLHVGYINYFKHKKYSDEVEIEVSKEILPYIIELVKSEYTSYYLTVAMSLKNKNSQRFYEYCSKFRHSGIMYLEIEELRKRFKLEDKYPFYALIKKYVIEPARKELQDLYDKNECDICFSYTEEKSGRSVKRIVIKIKSKEKERLAAKEKLKPEDYAYYIRIWLNSWFKTNSRPRNKEWVNEVMKSLQMNAEKLGPLYKRLVRLQEEKPPEDYPALARFIIEEDYL